MSSERSIFLSGGSVYAPLDGLKLVVGQHRGSEVSGAFIAP